VTGGAEVIPVPVKGIICGLVEALSVMVTVAVLVPAALGVKVTSMSQLPPAATLPLVGQAEVEVVTKAKSLLLVPVMVMPLMVKAAPPVLVSITVMTGLVVATS
jgi:hypothetical protein